MDVVKTALLLDHQDLPRLETYEELEGAKYFNPRPGVPGSPAYVYTETGQLVLRPPTVQQMADWHYRNRFNQKSQYADQFVGIVKSRGQRLGWGVLNQSWATASDNYLTI